MTNNTLFEPTALGAITLSNRIVMAPLTRNRAGAAGYTDYPRLPETSGS